MRVWKPRYGDIIISTPPKCATTWTQTICALLIFQKTRFDRMLREISPFIVHLADKMRIILSSALFIVASIIPSFAGDNMKAFPPAGEGMTRQVINLPEQEDETAFKVELVIGKLVRTDTVNHYFFGGAIEIENIPGWGFDRYILHKLGPMAGTLIAVNPNAPLAERFVRLGGEAPLLRYNSRLPLVVYVPAGVEVRYRLWRAEPDVARAPDG